MKCTDIQNQSPGGWFRCIDFVCTHSMYNWRHEVDVENRIDINHMEHDRSSKEPDASNSCHCERKRTFCLVQANESRAIDCVRMYEWAELAWTGCSYRYGVRLPT